MVHAEGPDGRPLELPYDSLVVAAGATHSYFGRDDFAEFAPGMKTIEDARHLRDRILLAFEMAELSTDPAERAEWLTFVVIGAGPTGVELVGQVAELAHTVLPRDYRSIDTREARILLLEGAPVGAAAVRREAAGATRTSAWRRWAWRSSTGTLAVGMDERSVTVKGPDGEETIRTRTRIWAAGVAASPLATLLARSSGAETDRAGRIEVNPDCTLPGHPEVFAIGDMVSLNKLPGVAQPAMQEGKYVGKLIKARLSGDQNVEPFKYFDKGSMATIGYKSAVADAFGMKVTGVPGLRHVGLHPRAVPDRLGQPARHALHLAARAGVHQEPRPPHHHLRAGPRAGRGTSVHRGRADGPGSRAAPPRQLGPPARPASQRRSRRDGDRAGLPLDGAAPGPVGRALPCSHADQCG